ncbi:MAG: nicotinate phosphoribosyltransferase [Bacteroidales bacterium]|nr:nicotinate phosphoribosyltransferase [Bacteroidales bacterium]MDD2823702.1 nicotinate phosphoribosyltransferase [Bacteroidales bacterium]MDD3099718.1 nicotinate phosphoribosyltransferase [Bacteroidales bacterium]MDD3638551.1 nicotinate phosphoribosyltransferase [Bacteroidales bacterium]MDD3943411.1 nicotinate phosphoribosyltransferase [Bacteroidales bacterium]
MNSYCSDKYQYTMGKTFVDKGLDKTISIFNMFYRSAPDNNNWAVVSGISEVLEMIQGFGSKPESFFRKFLPGDNYRDFCRMLESVTFTGDVYAMEEGQIVFPRQPVITVVAPLLQAQILETPMLCIMNHQMAVATKASRVTRSTTKPVSEFGSRRAHGPWAALHGAKAAYIAGCVSTSNILATTGFDIPSTGTMAHSYVTAFGCSIRSEYKAFDAYIKSHMGEGLILLVDTYDTLKSGIKNAIAAFRANNIDDSYRPFYGIRLDSGDLAYLSRKCRELLDREGLNNCVIFASNALDEYLISDLERQNAAIDSYGVGDAIATSKHNPCFGNVYKMVQIGDSPVLKLSEDKAKVINPGFQVTYRIYQDNENKADVTCLRGDRLEKALSGGKDIILRDEYDQTRKTSFSEGTYTAERLQHKFIENGKRIRPETTQQEKRDRYLNELSRMNPTERRIINPHYHKVDISDDLYDLKMKIIYTIKEELSHV